MVVVPTPVMVTLVVGLVTLTLRLVPVAVRAVLPANNSLLVPITACPVGAVPHVEGVPRFTPSHCVMFVVKEPTANGF